MKKFLIIGLISMGIWPNSYAQINSDHEEARVYVIFNSPGPTFKPLEKSDGYWDADTGAKLEGMTLKTTYEELAKSLKKIKSSPDKKLLKKEKVAEDDKQYLLKKFEIPSPEGSSFDSFVQLVVVVQNPDYLIEVKGTYPKPFDTTYEGLFLNIMTQAYAQYLNPGD